jgi:hypothetical protein
VFFVIFVFICISMILSFGFSSDPNVDVPVNTVNLKHRKIVSYQDITTTLHSIGDEPLGHGTHVVS